MKIHLQLPLTPVPAPITTPKPVARMADDLTQEELAQEELSGLARRVRRRLRTGRPRAEEDEAEHGSGERFDFLA